MSTASGHPDDVHKAFLGAWLAGRWEPWHWNSKTALPSKKAGPSLVPPNTPAVFDNHYSLSHNPASHSHVHEARGFLVASLLCKWVFKHTQFCIVEKWIRYMQSYKQCFYERLGLLLKHIRILQVCSREPGHCDCEKLCYTLKYPG